MSPLGLSYRWRESSSGFSPSWSSRVHGLDSRRNSHISNLTFSLLRWWAVLVVCLIMCTWCWWWDLNDCTSICWWIHPIQVNAPYSHYTHRHLFTSPSKLPNSYTIIQSISLSPTISASLTITCTYPPRQLLVKQPWAISNIIDSAAKNLSGWCRHETDPAVLTADPPFCFKRGLGTARLTRTVCIRNVVSSTSFEVQVCVRSSLANCTVVLNLVKYLQWKGGKKRLHYAIHDDDTYPIRCGSWTVLSVGLSTMVLFKSALVSYRVGLLDIRQTVSRRMNNSNTNGIASGEIKNPCQCRRERHRGKRKIQRGYFYFSRPCV